MTASRTKQILDEYATEYQIPLVQFDGLEEAVIGIAATHTQPDRIAYSVKKIYEILMRDQEMSYEEAIEWFSFNIESLWAGEHTPALIWDLEEVETWT